MKITVYTIKDCAFSKQEKEYLNTNKLVFEEKDLETNKSFLTEMLAISNNFAGTPVTRVEKDDGTIAVLKGFTKEEFDTTFGLAPTSVPADLASPELKAEAGSTVSSAPITTETPASPAGLSTETLAKAEVSTEAGPTVPNDPLKSVMDNLQSQSLVSTPPPTSETPNAPVSPIIDSPSAVPPLGAPAIPDFPAK